MARTPAAEKLKPEPEAKKSKAKKVAKVDDATKYLDALRAIAKDDEAFAFFKDDGIGSDVTEFIPTGSLAIDRLIGGRNGGWPVGRISECAAWEGIGKSTLLDQSIAEAQKMGAQAVLIETERSREKKYMQTLGVDLSKLISVELVDHVEGAFMKIDQLLDVQEKMVNEYKRYKKQAPIMFIVLDSLGGLPAAAELKGDADDEHVAAAARVINRNLRRIAQRISELRVAFVFTNHFYAGIGPFSSLNTRGGNGIKYFTSLRLWLNRKESIRVSISGEQVIVGHVLEAKLKKTRIRSPTAPVTTGLIYGAGIDNSYTLYEWGQKNGLSDNHRWIVRNGKWSYIMHRDGTHTAFEDGFRGLTLAFTERHDSYQEIAMQYLADGEIVEVEGETVEEEEEDDDGEES